MCPPKQKLYNTFVSYPVKEHRDVLSEIFRQTGKPKQKKNNFKAFIHMLTILPLRTDFCSVHHSCAQHALPNADDKVISEFPQNKKEDIV